MILNEQKSVFIKNGSRYQLTPAKRKELKAIDDQESENEVESSPEVNRILITTTSFVLAD